MSDDPTAIAQAEYWQGRAHELIAERDRLRAEVNDLTFQKAVVVGAKVQEGTRADDAEADAAEMKERWIDANAARAAADAEAIRLQGVEAERDRLRERVEDLEAQAGERERHLRDALKETRAENARLRAVVEAVREFERLTDFFGGIIPGDPDNTEDEEARAAVSAALDVLALNALDGGEDSDGGH